MLIMLIRPVQLVQRQYVQSSSDTRQHRRCRHNAGRIQSLV